MPDKPRCIDLFSGAGGLSCGLEMAGFESVFACEFHQAYANTYTHNHPDTPMFMGDIRKLEGRVILESTGLKVGELDLLTGGPPCQGFSINAPIRRLEDSRNQLVTDFLRLTAELQPKVALIENVPGIVSLGQGTVVDQIYKRFAEIGYEVHHKILFAGHYGVPQLRFRTIFLASRIGPPPIHPRPTHAAKARANFGKARELCLEPLELEMPLLKKATTVYDAISDLPYSIAPDNEAEDSDIVHYTSRPKSEFQKILRNGKDYVKNHSMAGLGQINLERLKHIPQGGSWRDIPYELLPAGLKRARRSDHTKRYGRLHPEGFCSTVLTKCDPHWGSFFHPYEDRVISVREAARFQSFPDHFEFIGNLTQQYAQVGNAVPSLMAKALGQEIMKVL